MAEPKRTPGGSPTAETRKKYAVLPGDRFPIWDKESAIDAINLRHDGTTRKEVAIILRAAAKFAPAEAKAAKLRDVSS